MREPTVILGAPRSGTNLLRDLLCTFPGWGTWDCDEINLVWRYGNRGLATDELRPEHARPRVRAFIRGRFEHITRKERLETVVEKTCANALRPAFVNAVLPEARFVVIVRDGRDAAASAIKRWTAPAELRYTLKKARYVPLSELPGAASAFVKQRFRQLQRPDRQLPMWGPTFEGLATILMEDGLAAACAAQWNRCVVNTERDVRGIDPRRVVRVRYEELVGEPVSTLERVAGTLDLEVTRSAIEQLASRVERGSVGRGHRDLGIDEQRSMERHLRPGLSLLGYA